MKRTIVKTVAVVLVISAVLALSGCGNKCRVGKKTKYKATDSKSYGAYITLDKGWSKGSGKGYAYKAYNNGSLGGSSFSGWNITSHFEYKNNKVYMTDKGKYENMDFTPSFSVNNSDATSITLMGKTYKY